MCDRIASYLCNIAQRRQDFGHPTFAAYVDLRAAFDSLSTLATADKAWYPGQDRLSRAIYDHSVSCVRTGGIQSP